MLPQPAFLVVPLKVDSVQMAAQLRSIIMDNQLSDNVLHAAQALDGCESS